MSRDRYKDKADAYEWSMDVKPKGKNKKIVHSLARASLKKELERDLVDFYHFTHRGKFDEEANQEASAAMYCYLYGPCASCKEAEDAE